MIIEKYSGKKPRGYVAPWWEMSASTVELVLAQGFRYDHSQGYNDFVPFYARVGDAWTKIDYSKRASEWMRPMKHGKPVDLVEIGANWYVDDLPPMMFIKKSPNRSYLAAAKRNVQKTWQRAALDVDPKRAGACPGARTKLQKRDGLGLR